MKALHIDRVSAGYGVTTVLRDVSLTVPAGKAVALLGPNGAGKTTLLKTVAGELEPFSGEISMGGTRIDHTPVYERSRQGVCLIPEGHAIFRQLTVRENLAMYARGRRVDEAVDRAATAFPVLGERLSQEAGTLSGGQQQMLALSRALIVDAQLILADELSIGLAPVVIEEIFAAVEIFRAEGRSLLIVEQYVTRALGVADYVYILNKGRVVFVGEPQQCQDQRIFEQYVGAGA
jgi:branched-chain amino acid transport system ATP-binding protein